MAQLTDIHVMGASEVMRSQTGSPHSPRESMPRWSMMELVGAASSAMSTEPGMESDTGVLATVPATAMAAVLEHARVT